MMLVGVAWAVPFYHDYSSEGVITAGHWKTPCFMMFPAVFCVNGAAFLAHNGTADGTGRSASSLLTLESITPHYFCRNSSEHSVV